MEIWKPVPGYDEWYEASTEGRIRSWQMTGRGAGKRATSPRVMKSSDSNKYGHQHLRMFPAPKVPKDELVHRVILRTFVGPCPEGMEAGHLDGDARNNRLENLAWVTPKENEDHKWGHGTYWKRYRNARPSDYAAA